ncbi:MAG: APC family permease [Elusimicrobia bacterium]|nr:APC family permease [Elusimicrobiota bacterium]
MNPNPQVQKFKQVLVLSTAMLTFISFWRAASVVLCDFGSSAYYAGGIAMKAFGPAFPWYIMAVMLFAGIMLMVYIESCSMFVRGGVYVVVKHAMGKVMAKFSVSALVFDYMLTGPISAVSAGLYISALLHNVLPLIGADWQISNKFFAVIFGVSVVAYFWKENIKGVEESSGNNSKIIGFVSVIAAVLLVWSLLTIYIRGAKLPPFDLHFTGHALGWAKHVPWLETIGLFGIFMAFGHSILALSGLETLAQVYREIEDPKIKNLKKAVVIIFLFSLMFTGVLTFLSALIIPSDLIADRYADNLLSGLALELHGPYWAKLILQTFVVVSGGLMLVGAVNTSFVGANGILNRVAEDGVLHDSFRRLHSKYGTTYRMINIIAIMQTAIIILSGGDIYLLGEAYAFGVLWSLVFNTASLIVLRFKNGESEREWLFPFNIKIKRIHFPAGLVFVFAVLLMTALMNLITKKTATISGIVFTTAFFIVFQISEKLNEKKARIYAEAEKPDEKLNLREESDINTLVPELAKPNKILVPVRNPNNLVHLKQVLETADDATTDILVLCAKIARGIQLDREKGEITMEDRDLFTAVVLMAEKYGKTVKPLLVFSNDPFHSIAQVAQTANVDEIVLGVSGTMGAEIQLERLAMAWGMLKTGGKDFSKPVVAKVVWEGRQMTCELT